MGTLEQYWRKASASLHNTFRRQTAPVQRLEEIEREILAFTATQQSLSGMLERLRGEYERHRSEQGHRFDSLEQNQRGAETGRIANATQLATLQQRLIESDAGRELEQERVTALESSLTETTHRLETRLNQLKFLQDSVREQIETFKTALAESASRLETRDDELRQRQDSAREQIVTLEAALAETTKRFTATAGEIVELRTGVQDQAQRLEASTASVSTRLEAANNRIEALEKQLETNQRLQQNRYQDLQAQLHRLGGRLKRTILVAALTLVLVAVAAVILLR